MWRYWPCVCAGQIHWQKNGGGNVALDRNDYPLFHSANFSRCLPNPYSLLNTEWPQSTALPTKAARWLNVGNGRAVRTHPRSCVDGFDSIVVSSFLTFTHPPDPKKPIIPDLSRGPRQWSFMPQPRHDPAGAHVPAAPCHRRGSETPTRPQPQTPGRRTARSPRGMSKSSCAPQVNSGSARTTGADCSTR